MATVTTINLAKTVAFFIKSDRFEVTEANAIAEAQKNIQII